MFACVYQPSADPEKTRPQSSNAAGSNGPQFPQFPISNVPFSLSEDSLIAIAHDFSPRYERRGDHAVVIDISGLGRLFRATPGGEDTAPPSPRSEVDDEARRAKSVRRQAARDDDEVVARVIGGELQRAAAARAERARVAIASTCTVALVLAHVRAGLTIVARGGEADALAPVPLGVLQQAAILPIRNDGSRSEERIPLSVFRSWGIRTLGELAALPPADLSARLGRPALIWQAVARGEDIRPLVPMLAEERFESSLDLDWPIEGLEPLSFVLTRLLEPLSIRLEQRDRGVAVLHLLLDLVGNPGEGQEGQVGQVGEGIPLTNPTRPLWARRLELPFPLRDVRTLRTLALLDLESHPPPAGIERVTIVVEPTPGRVLQHTLFSRAHPTPEQLATLLSRLGAMLGQDRIGTPAIVDSYRPGAFTLQPFIEEGPVGQVRQVRESIPLTRPTSPTRLVSAVRRYRVPIPAHVTVERGAPVRVTTRRGFPSGRIVNAAGPWRTSGAWWAERVDRAGEAEGAGRDFSDPSYQPHPPYPPHQPDPPSWRRDEWDVALGDGAVCRIFCDCDTGRWFVEAIFD
jgi:protein ImuB